MPFDGSIDLQQLSGLMIAVISILAAVVTALWIALVIWTFRDMRARSHDTFAQALAAVVVALLNIPGLLVYLILRPRETLTEQYERALEEEALLQEIEARQVCPGCSHAIRDAWRLCPYCHTKLRKPCVNCGELLELPWNVCPYCEATQADVPPRGPARAAQPSVDTPFDRVFEPDVDADASFADDYTD